MTTELVHLPMLNMWKVSEPSLVLQILRHKSARTPALSLLIEHAETKHGLAFPALKRAVSILPIFLEGEAQAGRRKSIALFLQHAAARTQARVAAFLQAKFSKGLRPQTDLVAELIRPVTGLAVEEVAGIEISPSFFNLQLIEIFNHNQNIAGLQRLEKEFAATLQQLEADGAEGGVVENRLIALVFGFDSLASFLADNLLIGLRQAQVEDNPLFLPEEPLGTGVPVTFRVASEPINISGTRFPRGARLMLELTKFAQAPDPATRQGIFGAGAHVCLGRMVSNAVWRAFRQNVNAASLKVKLVECKSRSSLFFSHFESIKVEISE